MSGHAPPSLLRVPALTRMELVSGLVGASVAFALVLLLGPWLLKGPALSTPDEEPPDQEPEAAELEETVVEARFVRLEGVLDDRRLPDKALKRTRTAPPPPPPEHSRSLSRERRERPNFRTDAGVQSALEDLIVAAGEEQRFDREFQLERRGHEEGIREGDALEADAWNLWATQIYAFFRRSWSPPPMTEAQRQSLSVRVNLQISGGLTLSGFSLGGSSGDADFDRSVQQCLQSVQGAGTPLPQPPPEIVDIAHTRPVALRFLGRHARRSE